MSVTMEVAKSLKPLVNTQWWTELETYVAWREKSLMDSLLRAQSYSDVCTIRGQIEEVKLLRRLRDDVNTWEK